LPVPEDRESDRCAAPTRSTGLTIRTALDPAQATAQVREAIRVSDPELPSFGLIAFLLTAVAGLASFLPTNGRRMKPTKALPEEDQAERGDIEGS
jgi:hypothetical protein